MKVIRVTNKYHQNPHAPIIEVGTETIVVAERPHELTGELMYQVAAVPPQLIGFFRLNYWYDAKGFAILPEPSADDMAEEKHEAIIYQR
jgi:hypothetical protein